MQWGETNGRFKQLHSQSEEERQVRRAAQSQADVDLGAEKEGGKCPSENVQ